MNYITCSSTAVPTCRSCSQERPLGHRQHSALGTYWMQSVSAFDGFGRCPTWAARRGKGREELREPSTSDCNNINFRNDIHVLQLLQIHMNVLHTHVTPHQVPHSACHAHMIDYLPICLPRYSSLFLSLCDSVQGGGCSSSKITQLPPHGWILGWWPLKYSAHGLIGTRIHTYMHTTCTHCHTCNILVHFMLPLVWYWYWKYNLDSIRSVVLSVGLIICVLYLPSPAFPPPTIFMLPHTIFSARLEQWVINPT